MFIVWLQDLTEPVTKPRTKYRCRVKNTSRGIIIEMKALLVKISQLSPREPNSSRNFEVSTI